MSRFVERLAVEITELNERYTKLERFLSSGDTSNITNEDKWLLHTQKSIMAAYLQILNLRMERATQKNDDINPESNN